MEDGGGGRWGTIRSFAFRGVSVLNLKALQKSEGLRNEQQ